MSCAPCMAGLGDSLNTYEGPVPPGVPNPYTVMLHSYPTRYHGPIYTRPEFGLPWMERPNDFALTEGMLGLGDDPAPAAAASPLLKVAIVVGLAGLGYYAGKSAGALVGILGGAFAGLVITNAKSGS